ncbi:MAG: hypothetical protein JSU86_08200, partial [Phycisphaerales bacterium]
QCPGDTIYRSAGATSHRIYVTYGTPGGPLPTNAPTNRRMNFVCNAGWNAGTELEVIDGVDPDGSTGGIGIHATLDDDPPGDPNDWPEENQGGPTRIYLDDWRIMYDVIQPGNVVNTGECHHQAHFMNLALQLIGMQAGIEYLTYASTDSNPTDREFTTAEALGITQDLDGDGVIGNEILELIFDFNPPLVEPPPPDWERAWNNFEGSIIAAGKYYAVWPSLEADSACRLLLEVERLEGAKQYWIYRGPTGGVAYYYPTEVLFPTCP